MLEVATHRSADIAHLDSVVLEDLLPEAAFIGTFSDTAEWRRDIPESPGALAMGGFLRSKVRMRTFLPGLLALPLLEVAEGSSTNSIALHIHADVMSAYSSVPILAYPTLSHSGCRDSSTCEDHTLALHQPWLSNTE